MDWALHWMQEAVREAQKAFAAQEVPVGAVLVRFDKNSDPEREKKACFVEETACPVEKMTCFVGKKDEKELLSAEPEQIRQKSTEERNCSVEEKDKNEPFLSKSGVVAARAHNETEQRHDPLAHAELLALQRGVAALGGDLSDCTLYVTMEPCPMCMGAILNARVKRLVFGAYDENAGCCGSVADLSQGWFPRHVPTVGGVDEEKCKELLQRFFREKRGK